MTTYRVGPHRGYRGHPPGSIFEAALDEAAEARALARGSITLVERSTPSLQPGSFRRPQGWLQQKEEANTP